MTVTPEDSTRLYRFGVVVLKDLAFFSTITLLHGVFIVVFSIAMYTTLHKGLTSRPTKAIFVLLVFSFTLTTIYWATWMGGFAIRIRSMLVRNITLDLAERSALTSDALYKAQLVQMYSSYLQPILSDGVVVWRSWVLFPEQLWVMVGPLFLLFCTAAVTLTVLVMYTVLLEASPHQEFMLNVLDNSTVALSMATNLFATLLIAYKLWDHRKRISDLGLGKRQSRVQDVLIFLVESGVVYCILQLASLLLGLLPTVRDTAGDYVGEVCYGIYAELSAMYPALVIVIINKRRSIVDTFGFNTSDMNIDGNSTYQPAEYRPATIGNLAFGAPITTSASGLESSADIDSESPKTS